MPSQTETATFGAGCFWCVEAIFQQLRGVQHVVSGYAGGTLDQPTYQQVCTGTTGHAEVVQITFEPNVISFRELLDVFWVMHDPTTLNRQGADAGTQYRSAIFYQTDTQREIAEQSKREVAAAKLWPQPIVTEIAPLRHFYAAENYHQNYFRHNPQQSYCRLVIDPKIRKFQHACAEKLAAPA